MSSRRLTFTTVLILALPLLTFSQERPAYRGASLPAEQRAADLLKRMTLGEKVEKQVFEQLVTLYNENSQVSPHDAAEIRNRVQHFLVEKPRLGIPGIFQGEALHGFMAYGSTSFLQVLGLASTWDPDLVQQGFNAAVR